MNAIQHWRDALAAWEIPPAVLADAEDSPWVLPRHVFVRRARSQLDRPEGASFEVAWQALRPSGSVLDVGAGAGSASLPLAPRSTDITAVDGDAELLARFALRASEIGVAARTVRGTWPEVGEDLPAFDVVVCHHVLYNAPDLPAFVNALTSHARRLVVLDLAERHPLTALNELWVWFHGIRRPDGPTADDAIAALGELGITPEVARWQRFPATEHPDFATMVDVTRRRLCLPRSRAAEVADALSEAGHGKDDTPDLGSSGNGIVTLSWPGGAG
ncbi:Methyltransferase domain-containing protein [Amycolatopsis marina]|uniref:Methyltransferase domain-containing protein n=1 Tax=Amycolatopsis marina TaxID=490629 RepID=A0A1I1C602_9PSEU|nr:methyltransferase domain-containing protein [Amycolatopsis marina]SFB57426.1 Methyltransferase domain-containing protein [Amycolatopsis marina]